MRFIPGHQGFLTKWTEERRQAIKRKFKGHAVSQATRDKIAAGQKAVGNMPPRSAIENSARNRGKMEASPSWKGGISYTAGRKCVYKPDHPRAMANGYVYEHLLIAEQMIGRPIASSEAVHHKDLNKSNNDPSNLQIFPTKSEHMRYHQILRYPPLEN